MDMANNTILENITLKTLIMLKLDNSKSFSITRDQILISEYYLLNKKLQKYLNVLKITKKISLFNILNNKLENKVKKIIKKILFFDNMITIIKHKKEIIK